DLARRIVQGAKRALGEVRALSRLLIPVEVHSAGLTSALADLAARIREQVQVDCTFAGDRVAFGPDSLTATHLFRLAQEAVSNALKHGRAKHIEISLQRNKGYIALRIANDGPKARIAEENRGVGLKVMRYRAGLIGGDLTIESAKSGGAVVTCTVPEERN